MCARRKGQSESALVSDIHRLLPSVKLINISFDNLPETTRQSDSTLPGSEMDVFSVVGLKVRLIS
ncbi:hypothetical protein AOLI_G00148100 [Acnodon oligacanthus]